MRVLRGTGIDPQRGLQDLNVLAPFLQKLEGEVQARLTTISFICGYMSITGALITKCCRNAQHVKHFDLKKKKICLESKCSKCRVLQLLLCNSVIT